MSEEWSDWFLHDGKGCPLSAGVFYESQSSCGCCMEAIVNGIDLHGIDWFPLRVDRRCNQCHRDLKLGVPTVIRYRIRKPRGMTILENLIADLPAPTRKVDS